ncbi:MAG: translocation/assembly module TamB domain-containing protein [Verrucomicrobia bacterium]|nr:translocation/assembly module TamB domain-containing protein [Verrucomicrobiota bacterium]MCH8527118.1 translocation/assembly module TamB domain-containing protein [Kiritimatiellia bacterium]
MKKFLKITGGLIFATALAVVVGVWLLISPAGMEFVTPWLNRQLSGATGMEARIKGLRWVHPLGLKFESLELTGEEETGLAVNGFFTRVSSRRLLGRNLHVYDLRADSVAFSGWPSENGASAEPEDPGTACPFPDLKALFERVTVEVISLPDIRILPPARDEPVSARLSGRFVDGILDLTAGAEAEFFSRIEARLRVLRRETFDQDQVLQADLTVKSGEVSLNGLAELSNIAGGFRVEVSRLDAEAFDRDLSLENPLTLERTDAALVLSETAIRIGEGRLLFEGSVSGDSVRIGVGIVAFPLDVLGLVGVTDPGAALEGRLEVNGTLAEPEVVLRMDFSGLKPQDPDLWEGPPAALRVKAGLGGGRGTLNIRIEDLPGDPVVLDLDAPVRLALQPFALSFPEDESLNGSLTSSTDLAGLSRLFVLDVFHRLSGRLDVDFRLDGTLGEPRLQGGARVVEGAYEHELTGFHLREPEFALSADRGLLRLEHFHARDGRDGRLMMDGEVLMEPGREMSFSAELTLREFQAVRQDELDAVVNGTLRWSGGAKSSRMEGQLALRPVEIRIPERMPHTVRTIEVTERFEDGRGEEEPEPEARPPRHRVELDLSLDSPDRIFVRGRGLDSEWSARLRMRGEVTEPVLTGELAILRGRFLFFGKRLVITRGRVMFDGAFPPDPTLDVLAELRSGGILGMLQVSGPAGAPEFELDSTPPLPEDEILARLLFGRESARITPWQALTLARAVHSLRGGGSAFDVMGTTRRMLQVDQIEIRSDDEQQGQTRVAVGRHVGDRMYVELERGAEAESGRARVEVELTPTLRLETQTGTDSDSGIGLRWRWDY